MADQLQSSGADEGAIQSVYQQVRDFFSGKRQQIRDIERARPGGGDRTVGGGGWGAGGPGAQFGGNSRFGGWGAGTQGYGGGGGQQQESSRSLHRRYVDYEQMDDYTDASTALDTYADEATQPDFLRGERFWWEGQNDNVVSDLNFLTQEQLNLERWIWPLTRTTAKYGNDFERMIVGTNGVVDTEPLPTALTRRVDDEMGHLAGFIVSPDGSDFNAGVQRFQNVLRKPSSKSDDRSIMSFVDNSQAVGYEHWEVSHFRMTGKNRMQDYGFGVLEPARWAWRRLIMMEDAALVHKLTKAPARYAFYVDVGQTSFKKSMNYVQKMKQFYQNDPVVDTSSGQIEVDYNPTAMHENYYIPVNSKRGEAVKIDTLNGPSYQGMEDVAHFENKFHRGVKIPNTSDEYQARSEPLTNSDIRFANAVMRLQKAIIEGMKKIANVHLIATGRNPEDFRFEGRMAVPSAIMELARIEVLSAKADIVSRLKEHVSVRWMLTNLFGFSEEEAVTLMVQREEEKDMKKSAEIEREMERERITNLMRESEEFPDDADFIHSTANRAASSGPRYAEGKIDDRMYEEGGEPDVDRFEAMIRENHEELGERLDRLETILRDVKSHSRFREQAAQMGNRR